MKDKVLSLLILTLIIKVKCCDFKRTNELKSLSIAIKSITRHLFESSGEVLIKLYDEENQTIESLILDNLKSEGIPFRVENAHLKRTPWLTSSPVAQKGQRGYQNISIIPLKSFQSLTKQQKDSVTSAVIFDYDHSHLTYVHAFDSNIELLEQRKKDHSPLKNFYFITEDENFILLKTFVWFLPGKCATPSLLEVNRFSKKENIWRNSQFTIKKFRNFHGCEIDAKVAEISNLELLSLTFLKQQVETQNSKRENAEQKLFAILINSLNFTLVEKENYGKLSKDFRVNLRLKDRNVKSSPRNSFFTQPHVFQNVHFAIPVGALYNEYEKMILPFDDHVWILILLTFFVAFATIFTSKFVHVKIRNFVIGLNVSTPNLNLLMIVFGIAQKTLPGRNFARFLVMTFILFCLIMRTAWQGKIFEFMQKDMRRPEVKSIEEMIAMNFTFYVHSITYNSLKNTDFGQM